jgi:hypothetical protein
MNKSNNRRISLRDHSPPGLRDRAVSRRRWTRNERPVPGRSDQVYRPQVDPYVPSVLRHFRDVLCLVSQADVLNHLPAIPVPPDSPQRA